MCAGEVDSRRPTAEERGRASCLTRRFANCDTAHTKGVLAVQGWISRACGSIGAAINRRPVWFIILSVIAAAAAAGGWARFRIESSSDKLWVPQDSTAMKDQDWVEANYIVDGGSAQFLASVPKNLQGKYGNNALQLPIFWEMFQIDAAIRNIIINDGDTVYMWKDVCDQEEDGSCSYTGPLNFWSMSFDNYLESVNGSRTDPTAGNRDVLIATVNHPRFPDNTSVSTLSLFGGIVLSPLPDPQPGQPPLYMSSAEAVSMVYNLRNDIGDDVEDAWYDAFLDVVQEWHNGKANFTSLTYIAGNSLDDEIGRSVTNDLYLIVVSLVIFILVAVMGLSRFHRVGTRSSLALLGVFSAVLAMIAGYGLSLLFNCPFNTLSQTLPYVLMGLAVDCMFILVKSYDGAVASDPSASLESRFRSLMSGAGTSVVVTLLASAVAFALGAISELPAVVWFSVYATMGVVCIAIATLTFFIGCFVLTERRIATNRIDCYCCATSGGTPLPTAATTYFNQEPTSNGAVPNFSICKGTASGYPVVIVNPASIVAPSQQQMAAVQGPVGESVKGAEEKQLPNQPLVPRQDSSKVEAKTDVPCVTSVGVTAVSSASVSSQQPLPPQHLRSPTAAEVNLVKKLFGQYYAPFLTKWYAKVAVIAVFIGWIVVCGVGIPQLQEGQPISELAPDDSYLQNYVEVMTDTFQQQVGDPTDLYFRWFDPSTPQQQANMLQALGQALDNKYVNATISAFEGNWLIDYIDWVQTNHPEVQLVQLNGCSNPYIGRVSGDLGLLVHPAVINGCVPQEQFLPLLLQFLNASESYADDVLFTYSNGTDGMTQPIAIWSSRLPVVHTAPGDDGSYNRKCLDSVRSLENQVNNGIFAADNKGAPGSVFLMYNDNYVYDEGSVILGDMTTEYVLLAVAGVGAVLALTLPSVRAVVMMMVAVGIVDYFLFGEMFVLGIRFNQVSVINMVMATGLSVDYSVYFAQRFVMVVADGSLNGRMVVAMADTGSAVFMGGLTALAGTIPLAFASSTILRTFFALIFGTIVFALLVGLMLMPVIFSLVGPPPLQLPPAGTKTAAAEGAKTDGIVNPKAPIAVKRIVDKSMDNGTASAPQGHAQGQICGEDAV